MVQKGNKDIQAQNKSKHIYSVLKRGLDVLGGITGLFIFSPLMIGVAIAVKMDSKGPIIFGHNRLGKNGEIIKVYKFRTMVQNAEEVLKNLPEDQKKEFKENFKLEKDPRITKVGSFLRRSSLDEFPQFLNVLKGDMSLVGPRPIINMELEKYGEYAPKLLSVKPGLTGNWQTSGRSETTYEERVKLDMNYIDNRTTAMDMLIILKTIAVVVKQVGAK